MVRKEIDWPKIRSKEVDRVMMLFWAANDEYAEVVSDSRRTEEVRDHAVDYDPPEELLPKFADDWTNGETIKSAKRNKIVPIETATYDSKSFKYRRVLVPNLEVLYAKRRVTKSEMPFALVLILPRK